MATPNPVIPISGALARGLDLTFNTGGFPLAFGFAGLLLTVLSPLVGRGLQLRMFYVGCALMTICLGYFMVKGIRTRKVRRRIKDDLPLLDGLQDVALQLSDLAGASQSVAFKYLPTIQRSIDTLLPLVKDLPMIGPGLVKAGIAESGKLSAAIVSATSGATETIRNVQTAIRAGDLRQLKAYKAQLSHAVKALQDILSEQ
jgi:hypothetical protein